MKTTEQIDRLLSSNYKTIEEELNIKIRNGQTKEGISKALEWVKR